MYVYTYTGVVCLSLCACVFVFRDECLHRMGTGKTGKESAHIHSGMCVPTISYLQVCQLVKNQHIQLIVLLRAELRCAELAEHRSRKAQAFPHVVLVLHSSRSTGLCFQHCAGPHTHHIKQVADAGKLVPCTQKCNVQTVTWSEFLARSMSITHTHTTTTHHGLGQAVRVLLHGKLRCRKDSLSFLG